MNSQATTAMAIKPQWRDRILRPAQVGKVVRVVPSTCCIKLAFLDP